MQTFEKFAIQNQSWLDFCSGENIKSIANRNGVSKERVRQWFLKIHRQLMYHLQAVMKEGFYLEDSFAFAHPATIRIMQSQILSNPNLYNRLFHCHLVSYQFKLKLTEDEGSYFIKLVMNYTPKR